MTIRHLRIFVTVCETGSMTLAGEKLYIAQPSVSLAISELEQYYGIKLFDRIAKRLHITESGKHFLQYASHIVKLFDDMENEVKNFDAIGLMRIGASITIGNYLLPGYIRAFKSLCPTMKINVTIDNTETIQHSILSNQLDIGLIEGFIQSDYITRYQFFDESLVMICANEHPFARRTDIDLLSLENESLIMRETGSAGREIFESTLLQNGMSLTPEWESKSTQAIVRAVKMNLGISILPYMLVEEALLTNEISSFKIKDIGFERSFFVIHHKNKFLTDNAKLFISMCTGEDFN